MKSDYPKIFEPITIKRTTIKNRIAMTPMGTNYGETSGEMSNRHMNYYSLRAMPEHLLLPQEPEWKPFLLQTSRQRPAEKFRVR